jgi:hypothetical protein
VQGTAQDVQAPETPLKPNTPYELNVHTGSATVQPRPGDKVGLQVVFMGVAPLSLAGASNVGLVLGANGSRVGFTLRVPDLDALQHQHAGWRHVRIDEFEQSMRATTARVFDLDVHHSLMESVHSEAPVGADVTVRIPNPETPEEGTTHGPWGTDNPHVVRMVGLGLDERFDVYPGEALLRDLHLAQPGSLAFSCEANCNATGTFAVLQVVGNGTGGTAGTEAATEQSAPIDTGKFFEDNLNLEQGEKLTWTFRTQPPRLLDWDVHAHPGNEVVTYQQGTADHGNGTFTAPAKGIYSLFFQNTNPEPVTLFYTVQGGTPYVPPPKSFLPVPGWVAIVALAGVAMLAGRARARP